MQIDVTPEEYRIIQDLRTTRPPRAIPAPEALKPLRWMLELDYFSQNWRGSVGEAAAPEGNGSKIISDWDEEGEALVTRLRHRARNSDAALRIQILAGAPREIVRQMLEKLSIVIDTDWEYLVYGPPGEPKAMTQMKDFYDDNDWYPVLPRRDEENG
jgi:hypothetical protein